MGHRTLVAASLALFSAGSVVCATAESFRTLLIGRCIKGTGGGGIISLVQVAFAREIPMDKRPKWFSLILSAWAVGTVTGPFVGSGLARAFTYRWVFWVNIPLNWVSFCFLPWSIDHNRPWGRRNCRIQDVDWLGSLSLTLGLTSLLLGLSWGGAQFPWDDYRTVLPLVLGFGGLVMTMIWERYYAKVPLLARSYFQPRSLNLVYASACIQGLTVRDLTNTSRQSYTNFQ